MKNKIMNVKNTIFKICILAIFLVFICKKNASAQCDNTTKFPSNSVNIACGVNTITNITFAGEYNVTKGYTDQSYLTFSSTINTDYITIRKASDNTILAHGATPVSMMYNIAYDSLEMHINIDMSCGTQNATRLVSVNVLCGCNNTEIYPANDVTISLGKNTISTSQYAGDYNITRGYLDGSLCIYSSSIAADFITIRKAENNQILVSGITPVALNYNANMGSIEMHINTNAACSIEGINRTTFIDMGLSIYKGGINDGFALSSFDQGPIPPLLAIYQGGIDDGFASTCFDQGPNPPLLAMYQGGIDDGFASTSFDQGPNPPLLAMYQGGIDDGFASTSFDQGPNPPLLAMYRGGIDDGFTLSRYEQCDGTTTRWMGNYSIDWHTAANWECGILPTITSDVIIPSDAQFFPTVTSFDEIRSLYLKPSSMITIPSSVILRINGL
jgi:hypothetical protein